MYPIQGSQLRFHLLLGTCAKDGGEFSRRDFQCDKWMSIKEPRSSQVFWQLTALLFWSFQFTLIFPIPRPTLFDISNFSFPRWHEFCTVLWGDTTVCSNRGLGVKRHLVPKYKYGCEKFSCLNYNIVVVKNLEDILWNICTQEHLRCPVLCLLQQGAEAMPGRFWGGGAAFPPRQVRGENTVNTASDDSGQAHQGAKADEGGSGVLAVRLLGQDRLQHEGCPSQKVG